MFPTSLVSLARSKSLIKTRQVPFWCIKLLDLKPFKEGVVIFNQLYYIVKSYFSLAKEKLSRHLSYQLSLQIIFAG